MKPLRERKHKLECERELLIRGHETAKKTLQPLWRAVRSKVFDITALTHGHQHSNTPKQVQKLVTPSMIRSQAKYVVVFKREVRECHFFIFQLRDSN